MRRLLLMMSVLSVLVLSGSGSAHATTSTGSFQWEAGSGVVCGVEETACPDIAMASNGDTITVRAEGSMNGASGAASGGGTFEHRNSAGTLLASGTLTATRLISFQFWGCDGHGLPSNLCGGRAELAVHLVGHPAADPAATIEADAIMTVNCLLGSPPSGFDEGIRLNVKDLINFNKPTGGDTLFIAVS